MVELKNTRVTLGILLFLLGGIQACATVQRSEVPIDMDLFPLVGESVYLQIPDRSWSMDRPDKSVGWCGETGIQMAMLYYGKYASQESINQAGRPDHPELYSYNIDIALKTLSISHITWNPSTGDIVEFIAWIKAQLHQGHPILCGVKIYPDEHPDWSLDHFVLVVGYDERGLIINTNVDMHGQQLISYEQLSSGQEGYSFQNKFNRFFARAITGIN
jgi:hypothetical protein